MLARSWRERVCRRRKHGPAAAKLRGGAKIGGTARRRDAAAMERRRKKMAEGGGACERLPLPLLPLLIASCGEAEEVRRGGTGD